MADSSDDRIIISSRHKNAFPIPLAVSLLRGWVDDKQGLKIADLFKARVAAPDVLYSRLLEWNARDGIFLDSGQYEGKSLGL